jgi:hypothetical protein
MDVIALPTPWPASTWTSAVVCHQPAAAIGCLYTYSLPLRLRPASTPTVFLSHHLHQITAIIVIVIVHFLFKQNFYF